MWLQVLQALCLVLVACVMAFTLAHAAELPGKMRLDKPEYLAIQPIYHPGYTLGGISEPLAILALAALVYRVHADGGNVLLPVACLVLAIAVQIVFWLAVHPVNKFWLAAEELPEASAGFFGIGRSANGTVAGEGWRALRDRWEYGHAVRAALAFVAFLLLAVHVVTT